jgi:uncharacterized membrane protein YdjX (TVP38/TMEM64 family)
VGTGASGGSAAHCSSRHPSKGGAGVDASMQQQQPTTPAKSGAAGSTHTSVNAAAGVSKEACERADRLVVVVRCLILLVLLGLSIAAARFCTTDNLHMIVQFVQEDPTSSLALFVIVYSTGLVLMVPGMMLGIGAGAAYGFLTGALVSWVSTCLGQTGAFLLGRYTLRDAVAGFLARKFPNFSAIDQNISQQGWKLVLLLRLSPFIPYVVLNYGLGVTSVDLWTYTWVSALSALPYVLAFAYLGAASNDLYDALSGHETTQAGLDWTIAMAAIMLLSAVLLGWACQKMLLQGVQGQGLSRTGSQVVGANVAYHKASSTAAAGDIQMEVLPTSTHSSSNSCCEPPEAVGGYIRAQSPAQLLHQPSGASSILLPTSTKPRSGGSDS